MKKVVLKLDMHDDKCKKKAMKSVSGLSGVESIDMNAKDSKLTITGAVDPVEVVDKLRRICHTEILSVGPAKEEKKPEAPKPAKEDSKKDPEDEFVAWFLKTYGYHPATIYYHRSLPTVSTSLPSVNPTQPTAYQFPGSAPANYRPVEEDPNSCVIC